VLVAAPGIRAHMTMPNASPFAFSCGLLSRTRMGMWTLRWIVCCASCRRRRIHRAHTRCRRSSRGRACVCEFKQDSQGTCDTSINICSTHRCSRKGVHIGVGCLLVFYCRHVEDGKSAAGSNASTAHPGAPPKQQPIRTGWQGDGLAKGNVQNGGGGPGGRHGGRERGRGGKRPTNRGGGPTLTKGDG